MKHKLTKHLIITSIMMLFGFMGLAQQINGPTSSENGNIETYVLSSGSYSHYSFYRADVSITNGIILPEGTTYKQIGPNATIQVKWNNTGSKGTVNAFYSFRASRDVHTIRKSLDVLLGNSTPPTYGPATIDLGGEIAVCKNMTYTLKPTGDLRDVTGYRWILTKGTANVPAGMYPPVGTRGNQNPYWVQYSNKTVTFTTYNLDNNPLTFVLQVQRNGVWERGVSRTFGQKTTSPTPSLTPRLSNNAPLSSLLPQNTYTFTTNGGSEINEWSISGEARILYTQEKNVTISTNSNFQNAVLSVRGTNKCGLWSNWKSVTLSSTGVPKVTNVTVNSSNTYSCDGRFTLTAYSNVTPQQYEWVSTGSSQILSQSDNKAYVSNTRSYMDVVRVRILYNNQWSEWKNAYVYSCNWGYGSFHRENDEEEIIDLNSTEMSVWPNPAQEKLNFGALQDLTITNTKGELVKEKAGSSTSMDISELPEGIYIIQGRHDNEIVSFKFKKQ